MFSEKLRTKRFIKRQYAVQKIGAINAATRDRLHAAMLISVVQQQAFAAAVVAAALQKRVDSFGLFRIDSYYNSDSSFAWLRQSVDMLDAVCDIMDHFIDQTKNAFCVFACVIPITAFATELIVRIAGLLRLVLTAVLTGILRNGVLVILPALHIAIVPSVIAIACGNRFR